MRTAIGYVGCKPAETIAYIDSDGIWKEGEEAQEIKRKKIEEVG
jgi:hypothetical protein